MKKIFCNNCDTEITISKEKIQKAIEQTDGRLKIVCHSCLRQLNFRFKSREEKASIQKKKSKIMAKIIVIENVFGYKQVFPLREGENKIGRRNKDTNTDIAIITGDPSMDRHHSIIYCVEKDADRKVFYLQDQDSMTGTFLQGREVKGKEKAILRDGDVITLGATSIIFSENIDNEDMGDDLELNSFHK